MNRTVIESARSMLQQGKMPPRFWAEAVYTAVYLRNRCPTTAIKDNVPYEIWYRKKPSVSHFRVFGCNVYVRVENASKFDAKAKRCCFVGYSSQKKGYRVYDIKKDIIATHRDVKFMESQFGNQEYQDYVPEKLIYQFSTYFETEDDMQLEVDENNAENEIDAERDEHIQPDNEDENNINEIEPETTYEEKFARQVRNLPEKRQRKRPDKLNLFAQTESIKQASIDNTLNNWISWKSVNQRITFALIAETECNEPKSVKEAWNGAYSDQWKKASDSEYQSLIKNETWDLFELPEKKNFVGSKWIFKIKRKADGSVDRFKARLVAQGYTQQYGLDYDEIFSPVARYNSIRIMLAIANLLDLEVHQLDVRTAFLNGKLAAEIYMRQPEGYIDKRRPDHVCLLKKSLYGLKQAARCWNETMDEHLKKLGYRRCDADCCIYVKELANSKIIFILLYVDDLLVASNDKVILDLEKKALKKAFEMEDQEEIHFCLGMSIKRDRNNKRLFINQETYLQNNLKRFEMENCKPIATPWEFGKHFDKRKEREAAADKEKFQSAIGCLIYAAQATRPDLSAAVNALSQFMLDPSLDHRKAVKRVLRYVKGTIDYGIEFNAQESNKIELIGYSDADWAGDIVSRKSTSGYVFKLAGAAVSWQSRRQRTVALVT